MASRREEILLAFTKARLFAVPEVRQYPARSKKPPLLLWSAYLRAMRGHRSKGSRWETHRTTAHQLINRSFRSFLFLPPSVLAKLPLPSCPENLLEPRNTNLLFLFAWLMLDKSTVTLSTFDLSI